MLLPYLCFSLSIEKQWSEDFEFSSEGKWAIENRNNPFKFNNAELRDTILKGKFHALKYPVNVTPLLFPYSVFEKAFDEAPVNSPARKLIYKILKLGSGYKTKEEFFEYSGHIHYPKNENQNYSKIPFPSEKKRGLPMGGTLIHRYQAEGLTFGCASCHSADLFGKKVLGLSARFPKGNDLFLDAKKMKKNYRRSIGKYILGMSDGELKMMADTLETLDWVRAKKPVVLGLDTSLSQVGASLHYRQKDEYASKIKREVAGPHILETKAADSKPAVWWNLKYKTRWLSDGSLVSGNPVYTNFLWNEIGRGTDLKELETWIDQNQSTIKELTTSVFSTKAPNYLDFFDEKELNLHKAMRGEVQYKKYCERCHGQYIKNWSVDKDLEFKKLVKTKEVRYHKKTPVVNVGTDPGRFEGMKYFSDDLNRLAIQKNKSIKVLPQVGYVPPPLVGIWARWPYFHNNSAPSLCVVLTQSSKRPKTYWAVKANDPDKDFDKECNGYPLPAKISKKWKKNKKYYYDTAKAGMRNTGHDKKIFVDKSGKEYMTKSQKLDLIEFLKTL